MVGVAVAVKGIVGTGEGVTVRVATGVEGAAGGKDVGIGWQATISARKKSGARRTAAAGITRQVRCFTD
jgi:hypothetical protein